MGLLAAPASATVELNPPGDEVSVGPWLLAAAVALLTAHVGLGWVRIAQRHPGLRRSWGAQLIAAAVLGTGICATVLLTLAGEPLDFALGYRSSAALALWLGAMLGCLLPVLALSDGPPGAGVAACGSLLGLLAGAVQVGWLAAAGFLPGLLWQLPVVLAALMVMMVGFGAALALALLSADRRDGPHGDFALRRFGAAAVFGASLFAGQEIMVLGVGLALQQASAYSHEMADSVLNMVSGALVPALLAGLAGHLELRRRGRRRRIGGRHDIAPLRRRKRHDRRGGV